jgi:hypothetical protein
MRTHAHPHAEISLGQSQRVVLAVANHSGDGAAFLAFANDLGRLNRENLGAETLGAKLPRNCFGGATRIAGNQMRLDATVLQFGNMAKA